MPYFIKFDWEDGRIEEHGPIVPDNPKSTHGLEDRKIKRSCDNWVKWNNRHTSDAVCSVIHKPY